MLQKTTDAKNKTIEAEGLESIQLAVMASRDDKGINTTSLAKNLSEINGLTDTNNQSILEDTDITLPKSVKLNNVKYKIKEDGTVIINNLMLPDEYQQVEYLESNGKQYFKINQTVPNKFGFHIKYFINSNDARSNIFGGFVKNNSNKLCYLLIQSDNIIYYCPTSQRIAVNSREIGSIHEIDVRYSNGITYIYYDNLNKASTHENADEDSQIAVFSFVNTDGSIRNIENDTFMGRIYELEFYERDNIVVKLIPALDSNRKPCMYDTISEETYYNQGTGEFITGPEV